MLKTFFILVTFFTFLTFFLFFQRFLFIKKRWQNGMQMTRNTVSDSNKAMTFRQLNRTVPFLVHPACRHTVWEWFWKNSAKFCGTIRVFLYLSCKRARHSTKCRFNVFYSTQRNAMRTQGSGVSLYAPSRWQKYTIKLLQLIENYSCFRFLKFLFDNYIPFLG